MDEALKVIAATGGGLAPAEFHTGFIHGLSANPLNADFAPLRGVRHANESIEAVVRGGHAYDVLKRGGSTDLAIDTVTKWHFNYRDISNFDRKMKNVIPFWAFFSKNIGLQAHVWTHELPKLNRTYFNLQRNMGHGQPQEVGAPGWLTGSMPLPLSINPGGVSTYLNPGLPTTQFAQDAQNAVSDPTKLLSNLAPWFQLPIEGVAGKNLYTGAPNTGYRDAGPLGMIPGMSHMPGFAQAASGDAAVTPFAKDILQGAMPWLGQANRFSGNDPAGSATSWLTGVSVNRVTPAQRKAEAYKQILAQKSSSKKRKDLAKL